METGEITKRESIIAWIDRQSWTDEIKANAKVVVSIESYPLTRGQWNKWAARQSS